MRNTFSACRAHVLGAHVDDAFEPEQRARGGARHAVLAGAGLGDDARLAHALGEQRLAERVVDLVRAGVREVFALEEDAAAAARLGEPLGFPQRRWPADVMREQARQLRGERGILPCARDTRARAPRLAPPASPARSARRTRRNSRARPDRAARTTAARRPFVPLVP